jgi:hypothetical protein
MKKFTGHSKTLGWSVALLLSGLAAGCGGGGDPVLGEKVTNMVLVPPPGAIAPGAVCPVAGPRVTITDPTNGNLFASTSTSGVANSGKLVTATFSEAMNAATINAATFKLAPTGSAALTPASVGYNSGSQVATLTTASALLANTAYTAVIQAPIANGSGTPIGCTYTWSFKTAATLSAGIPSVPLLSAARFGTFGGTAGTTNEGTQTLITGSNGATADIGTTATDTSTVTGFQDSAMDVYTVVPGVNQGLVTGKILTCTTSTTGPTNPTNGVNAASCTAATQARLDAQTAYLALAAMPVSGLAAAANLAGLTLAPGVYKAPSGSFMIQGGDLTLDAQGDANAVFVFQMATTLNVGGPGAAFPQSVKLINGATAKNVFWQVGSAAIINAGGGGTMEGTIIAQAGAAFSTAGNVNPVTLNGRALSLGASVTLVNTVIRVPAP